MLDFSRNLLYGGPSSILKIYILFR